MTDRPKASTQQPRAADPEAENPVEEVRYDRDQLVTASAALLNSRPDVIAGALALAPAGRKTFTLAEAEELAREYTDREIVEERA
jgi:hypothetical protein